MESSACWNEMYKLKSTVPKMLPCGTPKLLSLMDELLSNKLNKLLSFFCAAFPMTLGDRLYQMPSNSPVEFQGWPR